jgi:hypothetical protein
MVQKAFHDIIITDRHHEQSCKPYKNEATARTIKCRWYWRPAPYRPIAIGKRRDGRIVFASRYSVFQVPPPRLRATHNGILSLKSYP